jgi:plasmid stability protein
MLDDGILRELKKRAAAEGRSVQAVAHDLLRQALEPAPCGRLPDARGTGRGRPALAVRTMKSRRGLVRVDMAKDWEMLMSARATMRAMTRASGPGGR